MRRAWMGLWGSLLIGATATPVAIADDTAVSAKMTAARVVMQQGQETLVAAEQARPGEVLEYRVEYHNTTRSGVSNLVATLPVPPDGVEFIPGTDVPKGAQASLDGKTFAPIPLMRAVKLPGGRTEMKPVPVGEYRYLRWNLGTLPANAQRTVSARVRLVAPIDESALSSSKPDGIP